MLKGLIFTLMCAATQLFSLNHTDIRNARIVLWESSSSREMAQYLIERLEKPDSPSKRLVEDYCRYHLSLDAERKGLPANLSKKDQRFGGMLVALNDHKTILKRKYLSDYAFIYFFNKYGDSPAVVEFLAALSNQPLPRKIATSKFHTLQYLALSTAKSDPSNPNFLVRGWNSFKNSYANPVHWSDGIHRAGRWVETRFSSDSRNLYRAEVMAYKLAMKEAKEIRFPHRAYSKEECDRELKRFLELNKKFQKENWAAIQHLEIECRALFRDVCLGAGATTLMLLPQTSIATILGGSTLSLGTIVHFRDQYKHIMIEVEDLARKNPEFYDSIARIQNMDRENRKSSLVFAEQTGYIPQLRFQELQPKGLFDYSQGYVDIHSDHGTTINVTVGKSF